MDLSGSPFSTAESAIEFETPENVRIRYPVAGPGTRFLAWLLDWMLTVVLTVVVLVVLLIVASASGAMETLFQDLEPADLEHSTPQTSMYVVGLMLLVMAFGSFFYFFVLELLMRGQTIGKRILGLRVVKGNGFSLDPLSLLIRNLFRFVDHLPLIWAVPILSRSTQRPGDMVAGTLVVRERSAPLSDVRAELARRDPLAARFRFDAPMLARLRPVDLHFVEGLLDRWNELPRRQLRRLLERSLPALCQRLHTELPSSSVTLQFLEDLLTAEYRHRCRTF